MPVSAAAALGHFQSSGFTIVPVTASHVLSLESLPYNQDDPFDRLLIATAHAEPYRLLTADARLSAYGAMATLARRATLQDLCGDALEPITKHMSRIEMAP